MKQTQPSDAAPSEDALRANVRLLGELLGEVISEQRGAELYELEEEIRALSHAGRGGDEDASRQLRATLGALDLERQALVMRAFGLYFQLANIAEQHHRVRRRRAYEREGRIGHESIPDAIVRLEARGVGAEELRA